ncbi:MFS transporter [Labrys okinawensis]|uniref:MFS transporter n=1 Tax=Labrys okinawensis TaxID=346911 RepID=UPI0039BC3661
MSSEPLAAVLSKQEERGDNAQIIATVFITFIGFLSIGLPLAVLPTYVHITLGYSTVMAGFAISIQYIATVLTRARVGQIADTRGPKLTVIWGLYAAFGSGALLFASALCEGVPALALGLLLASRLSLGICESLIGTGAIAWAIGRVGPDKTARIIAWNGVSTYGALAVGAPAGVAITGLFGFAGIGIAVMVLAVVGFALALPKPATAMTARDNLLSFRSVLLRVLPHGTALALATAGFGTITTFVTLFYAARQWDGAAYALSAFGLAFIACRLSFADTINRRGGFPVAIISLVVQVAGLVVVWGAIGPMIGIVGAAVTGLGFSLVFPAIGVEAVRRVPTANRGSALGLYSMFLDVSLGITGPAAGWISSLFSEATPFLFGAVATLLGLGITVWLATGKKA